MPSCTPRLEAEEEGQKVVERPFKMVRCEISIQNMITMYCILKNYLLHSVIMHCFKQNHVNNEYIDVNNEYIYFYMIIDKSSSWFFITWQHVFLLIGIVLRYKAKPSSEWSTTDVMEILHLEWKPRNCLLVTRKIT